MMCNNNRKDCNSNYKDCNSNYKNCDNNNNILNFIFNFIKLYKRQYNNI